MTSSLGVELKLYLEPGEDNDDPTADDPGKVSHSRLEINSVAFAANVVGFRNKLGLLEQVKKTKT